MKLSSQLLFISVLCLFGGCKESTKTNSSAMEVSPAQYTLKLLNETRTTQYFTDEQVPIGIITSIIDAGRCAASGRNKQDWHFGAIINPQIIKEIASSIPQRKAPPAREGQTPPTKRVKKAQMADAPAIIAIASTSNNMNIGLACQNMVIAASALGYGTKIVMSGTAQLDEDHYRTLLNTPEEMKTVAVLYIGREDSSLDLSMDGMTGASTRKTLEEVGTIVE